MQTKQGKVLQLKTGLPQQVSFSDGETIETAIKKQPVESILVDEQGIVGNDVGLKQHHGGADKAIFFMAANTFDKLNQLSGEHFAYDGTAIYGENIVLSDFDESNVCIGDRFLVGECEFEVSQPRRPCSRLSKNTGNPRMKDIVFESGLTGWYVRIIRTGKITKGDNATLLNRPYPQWTVAKLNCWLADNEIRQELADVIKCDALADAFRQAAIKRLNGESGKVKG